MAHGQLVSHVDTDLVTRDQLRAIPVPTATSTFKPIPHIELVESLEYVLRQNRMAISQEQFAIRRDGSALFAVLKLSHAESEDGTAALGLRTANNKTMSIQICAGLTVFVCDNLAFRGDLIALKRKHTSGLNLRDELVGAVLRFRDHFSRLVSEIDGLKKRELTDLDAKGLIHDAFAQKLMPVRLLPAVSTAYFDPKAPELEPRNAWSLHNAFTALAKDMPLSTRLAATQELGRLFGMASQSTPQPRLDVA
jgi:hypothetical protein